MTEPRGLPRRAALGLITAGALSACGLRPDGTIRQGLDVDASGPRVDIVRPGPEEGQSPEEIIKGFLVAGEGSGSGLENARKYLTKTCSEGWNPDFNETIVWSDESGTMKITEREDRKGFYEVSVPVQARIDQDARYLVAPTNDGASFTFGLDQVGGEWRISYLQEGFGRVLTTAASRNLFAPYDVFYPNKSATSVLVPDQRYVVKAQAATRLTLAQLADVPDYLADAVVPSPDAELTLESVIVRDEVAHVDLKGSSVPNDAKQRERLAAQLVTTLTRIENVSLVEITVEGAPMSLEDVPAGPMDAGDFQFTVVDWFKDPLVFGRVGTRLDTQLTRSLTSPGESDLRASQGQTAGARYRIPEKWTRVGVRADGDEVAAVDKKGQDLVRWRRSKEDPVKVPSFAANLTSPCYDNGGVLWVGGIGLGREVGQRLFHLNTRAAVGDPEGSVARHVDAAWLGADYVVAAALAPEGSRIAVISEEVPGTGSQLRVSGIVREVNGLPKSTSSEAVRCGADIVEMVDMVWVGSTTLAVIGRRDKERGMRPFLVDVNGEVKEVNWPPEGASRSRKKSSAERITSISKADGLIVTTADGRVWHQRGTMTWTEIEGLDAIVTAGA